MPVVIGAKPESDFTDPIGMLGDCHRRIERFLTVLIHVASTAKGAEMTLEQRSAFENALRYFREAAPKHTADEEESLFPRLRTLDDPNVPPLLAIVDSLEQDHGRAEQMHAEVDQLGRRWLQAGRLLTSEAGQLQTLLTTLQAIYREHIHTEDTKLFPAAAQLISPRDQRAIGEEMRLRR